MPTDWETRYYEQRALHTESNGMLADEARREKARADRLEAFVKDLAEEGTRHDLSPTLNHHPQHVASEYLRYLKQMDDSIRKRASAALAPKT